MDQIFIRNREVATKEYVDNKIEDMDAMATKTYVDEKIASANVIAGQGITNIVQLTQAQYDALAEKDSQTLYLIMG